MNGNNARTFTPIYDDFELQGYAVLAYSAIYRFCTMRNGECTASNETLAKAAHLPVRTFRRYKKWLEDNGYITNTEGPHNNSVHILQIVNHMVGETIQDDLVYGQRDHSRMDTVTIPYGHSDQGDGHSDHSRMDTVTTEDTIKILNKDTNRIPPQDTGNVDEEMSQKEVQVDRVKEKDPAEEAVLGKIFKSYENEIGNITPIISEKIKMYLDDGVDPQWIIRAIEISSENNARCWAYTEGILKRWIAQGNQNDYRQKVDNSQFPSERGWSTV